MIISLRCLNQADIFIIHRLINSYMSRLQPDIDKALYAKAALITLPIYLIVQKIQWGWNMEYGQSPPRQFSQQQQQQQIGLMENLSVTML